MCETAIKSMSRPFSELEDIHIEHFATVAIRQCGHLIGRREIAAVVGSGVVHTDIVHQQGYTVVSIESGFPFRSHPLSNVRIDAVVKFSCHGSGFGIREQIAHRIVDIDIEMFTLRDTGGDYLCLRDVNKESLDVSDVSRRTGCRGNRFRRMLMDMFLMQERCPAQPRIREHGSANHKRNKGE